MIDRVIIFDTTLRDGEQALKASLTVKEKLQINSEQRQNLDEENSKIAREINQTSLNLKDITAKTEITTMP